MPMKSPPLRVICLAEASTAAELQHCYRQGLKLLAPRDHAPAELERKLQSRGYDSEIVAQTLARLEDEGSLDRERYSESYIRSRAAKGYGPRRIAQELQQRGIDRETVARQLQQAECDWFELARQCHQKHHTVATSAAERAKQQRYLQQHGFESEQIRYALTLPR
ncbi:regulatory protein RecX [Ectothiorhodospiraceae bacterium BW-2]|nr:regulatory protein RecX [Ectothiorhodospiraceae bacterium BW-2]